MSGQASIASRTAFQNLAIDSGEESEVEVEVEESSEPIAPVAAAPKLTKTAQKKAAKAAKLERQQRHLERSHSSKSSAQPSRASTPLLDSDYVATDSPVAHELPADVIPETVSSAAAVEPIAPAGHAWNGSATKTTIEPMKPSYVDEQPIPLKKAALDAPIKEVTPVLPAPPKKPTPEKSNGHSVAPAPVSKPGKVVQLPTSEPQETEKAKKIQRIVTRTLSTFVMISGFICLLLLGHVYMILLVMLCQTIVYREVTQLFSLRSSKAEINDSESKGKDPWSLTLNWYFFAVTNYFLYGESIIYYFKHVVFVDAHLLPFVMNHRMISFILYLIGFVGFVMSLKKGYLKQQFGLFCWVHMSLLLIVVSSHFVVNNILEGMIWFWVPASLVICNDIFAYIWGMSVGRTPLIALSPKKTVEGFVGALFSTILFGFVWGTWFMQYDYMICPVHDLGVSAWSSVSCTPNPIFVWTEWQIWKPTAVFLSTLFGRSITTIPYAPFHIHLLVFSVFASLVAPFGGFFASGFKRAFNIKDFGHSIPGHGGMTDRMDCQFLMGVFTYVYYSSLIREHHVTVGSVLQVIVSGLTIQEQVELYNNLKMYLHNQGVPVA